MILFTVSAGFVFADSANSDPFDSLVEKLLKDFDDDGATVAVKVFTSDLGNNERKKISKSVQFSLYCSDIVEVVAKSDDADYICTGKIEADGPNYIISAKLIDNYDDTVIGKAKQKVPKDYYAEKPTDVKVQTVVVEDNVDADDILGAIVVGSIIGGVFHAVTTPPRPVYVKPSRPNRPNRPSRPNRP
jgi:TolB-like protein